MHSEGTTGGNLAVFCSRLQMESIMVLARASMARVNRSQCWERLLITSAAPQEGTGAQLVPRQVVGVHDVPTRGDEHHGAIELIERTQQPMGQGKVWRPWGFGMGFGSGVVSDTGSPGLRVHAAGRFVQGDVFTFRPLGSCRARWRRHGGCCIECLP